MSVLPTTEEPDQIQDEEQAAPAAESPAEAPLTPEEIARRTAGGMARWLAGSVAAFWLAVIGVVAGMLHMAQVLQVVAIILLFVTLITTVVLYFSVMLEPATFTDRRVKLALGFSFADLGVLTLIFIFAKLYLQATGAHPILLAALAFAALAAAVAVLAYAFRKNQRFIFLLAVAILLAANLVPVGK